MGQAEPASGGAAPPGRRVGLLASVASALSSAGSITEVMAALVSSLSPALCDGCEVAMVDDDGVLRRVAVGPVRGGGGSAARRLQPIPDAADHPLREVMATGKVLVLDADDPADLARFGPPEDPTSARSLGLRTAVVAPMTGRREVLGVLGAANSGERAWPAGDVEFVASVARLAGLAVENLRTNDRLEVLLAEQRHVARVLQASLLPIRLPPVDGFDVSAHYWAEGDGISVGGDFYDVITLGAGRYGILVGDVCGKGVEAAAITSTARHTARAAGMHLDDPAAVLRWVHEAIAATGLRTFCTVAYAVLDTTACPATVAVSLAGHPPGIVVRADGTIGELGTHGTLLGMIEPSLRTERYTVHAGDLLAFYTDGITDAPGAAAMGRDELARFIADRADHPLDAIGAALHAEILARRRSSLRDDIALVLLRRDGPPSADIGNPPGGCLPTSR